MQHFWEAFGNMSKALDPAPSLLRSLSRSHQKDEQSNVYCNSKGMEKPTSTIGI